MPLSRVNSTPTKPARDYVLRDTGSILVFWIGCCVLAAIAVEAVVRGDGSYTALMLPLGSLIAWVLWLVLFRPQLRYNPQRAIVTNIGRIHEIPWGRVSAVRQRLNVTFELRDGSTIRAAGVTAQRGGGHVVRRITSDRVGDPSVGFDQRAATMDALRDAAAPSDSPVVSRWDTLGLGVGAVLAAIATIAVLIAAL